MKYKVLLSDDNVKMLKSMELKADTLNIDLKAYTNFKDAEDYLLNEGGIHEVDAYILDVKGQVENNSRKEDAAHFNYALEWLTKNDVNKPVYVHTGFSKDYQKDYHHSKRITKWFTKNETKNLWKELQNYLENSDEIKVKKKYGKYLEAFENDKYNTQNNYFLREDYEKLFSFCKKIEGLDNINAVDDCTYFRLIYESLIIRLHEEDLRSNIFNIRFKDNPEDIREIIKLDCNNGIRALGNYRFTYDNIRYSGGKLINKPAFKQFKDQYDFSNIFHHKPPPIVTENTFRYMFYGLLDILDAIMDLIDKKIKW